MPEEQRREPLSIIAFPPSLKAPGRDGGKLRAAAYCRVSTGSEEQLTSYTRQVRHYSQYLDEQPDYVNCGIYADEGISGTGIGKRQGFLRMMDDCREGKLDLIITKSVSRFGRNTVDYLVSVRELKALGSPDRLRIVALLGAGSMNVQQIARAAGLPLSTAGAHVRMLEDAGILMSEPVPGAHGAMKLCSRRLDVVTLRLMPELKSDDSVITLPMPVGGYSRVIDVQPTCGLVNDKTAIGEYDNPYAFYLPGRFDAQLLWLRSGFVEYRFGLLSMQRLSYRFLELSFEACSEAPMYRNPWKSDISIYLNDLLMGVWQCPADLGGRPCRLNPAWWPEVMTQHGYLCTLRVDQNGSFLNDLRLSQVSIDDLRLKEHDCITLRLGVAADAEHVGGMNLFGERFGDFEQALVMKIGYAIS